MKNLFLLLLLLAFCSGKCFSHTDPYRVDSIIKKENGKGCKTVETKSEKKFNEKHIASLTPTDKTDSTGEKKGSTKDKNKSEKKLPDSSEKPAKLTGNKNSSETIIDSTLKKNSDTNSPCKCLDRTVQKTEWWLVFTPIILFLILMILLLFRKELRDFDFKGALAENEIPKYTILNPEYSKTNGGISTLLDKNNIPSNLNEIVPPTIDVSIYPGVAAADLEKDYRPSISRYIAFFSGMLTVILAVCMTSFYIYFYIHTNCPPDLGALSNVLIALGIGITPYAVNKVSTAIASRKPE